MAIDTSYMSYFRALEKPVLKDPHIMGGFSEFPTPERFPAASITSHIDRSMIRVRENCDCFSDGMGRGVLARLSRIFVEQPRELRRGGNLLHQHDKQGQLRPVFRSQAQTRGVISAVYWIYFELDEKLMAHVTDKVGENEVFRSTDFPHTDDIPSNAGRTKKAIQPLLEEAQSKVLGENVIHVYGLKLTDRPSTSRGGCIL